MQLINSSFPVLKETNKTFMLNFDFQLHLFVYYLAIILFHC